MGHFVYILYSESLSKYYIGYSTNPSSRLDFHNSSKNRIWSKRGQPWVLKKTFSFSDKTSALKAEKHIKRMKNRAYLERLLEQDSFEVGT